MFVLIGFPARAFVISAAAVAERAEREEFVKAIEVEQLKEKVKSLIAANEENEAEQQR